MGARAATSWLALAIALASTSARADAPSVDVFLACPGDAAARIEAAAGGAERSFRWVPVARVDPGDVLRRPAVDAAPSRVWIDCGPGDRVRLAFADPTSERFLVRDVPAPRGLDEVALETLAQVIDSSLSALESDAAAALDRAQVTSVLAPPEPAPAAFEARPEAPAPWTKARWRAGIAAFYAVEAFGAGPVFQHGPGLAAGVGRAVGAWNAGAWMSAQIALPELLETSLIGARLDVVALRGGAEVARAVAGRVALGARVGAGADVVHVSARQGSGGATAELAPDRTSVAAVAQAAVTIAGRVGSVITLSGAAIADVDLASRHYDVAVGGATVRAFTPWPVRPGLVAGLGWP
jgi:hypothetical protein